ncbi:hypothetical protein BDAP_001641 [Binucleata daphniae]
MDEMESILDEITRKLDHIQEPKNITDALEQESTIAYLYYSLCICEQKLTNKLDKKTIENIKALKNNFEIIKKVESRQDNVKQDEVKQDDIDFLNKMYKNE